MENQFVFDLLVMLVLAKVGEDLARRFQQPAMVGQLVFGVILGAIYAAVGRVPAEWVESFGVIGILLLLFVAGLETNLRELLKTGIPSSTVAVCGVVVPFAGGYVVASMAGYDNVASCFIGASLVSTSVAVKVEILRELKMLTTRLGTLIIGSAVIDDVIGIFILSILLGFTGGSITLSGAVMLGVYVVLFVGLSLTLGVMFVKRTAEYASRLQQPAVDKTTGRVKFRKKRVYMEQGALFVGLSFMLLFAIIAEQLGVAMITGAFVAGLILGEIKLGDDIYRRANAMGNAVFIPLFFLQLGMEFEMSAFLDAGFFAFVLVAMAFASKIVGCGVPARIFGYNGWPVGIGMVPRGEVGLIVAKIALDSGLIDKQAFSSVLVMVIVTTFMTPTLFKNALERIKARQEKQRDAE